METISISPARGRSLDSTFHNLSRVSMFLVLTLILWLFTYVINKGLMAFKHYDLSAIFWNSSWEPKGKQGAFFWGPFLVTIFLIVCVVILTIPIALRFSIWFTFYLTRGRQRVISNLILFMVNIPSVIMGHFIKNHFSYFIKVVFGLQSSLNLITATFALVFISLPITITLFNAGLSNKTDYIISSEILGVNRNYSIYKVIVPRIRRTIWIAATIISSKTLNESTMLSMILAGENYSTAIGGGFSSFILSQLNPLAPLISENFFSDGSTPHVQDLLFLFGGLLLLTSLMINVACNYLMGMEERLRDRHSSTIGPLYRLRNAIHSFLIHYSFILIHGASHQNISRFIYLRVNRCWFRNLKNYARNTLEGLSVFTLLFFTFSLLTTIFLDGINALISRPAQGTTVAKSGGESSLAVAISNTFFIVFMSLFFCCPIALLSALYLTEYCHSPRVKRYILYVLNIASSTPSIIFGIFGLSFFIYKLGWSTGGTTGKSILSGILTISLLILPYMIHLFHGNISNISPSYRESSYALGVTKIRTFTHVVLPLALENLIFTVLISAGKIMGETAPFYLTAGLTSVNRTLLMYPGQTLTTRIYSQMYEQNLEQVKTSVSESSLFCVIYIFIVIYAGKELLPRLVRYMNGPPGELLSSRLLRKIRGYLLILGA